MINFKLLFKWASALLLCVLITQITFAQTKTITGKVTDDKGAPIQGATVVAKGSKSGTSTNATGAFTLNMPDGVYALTVSSVGYTEQDVNIVGLTTVSVSLVSSSQSLNDVIVIGYGTARRRDVTGAISSVQAKNFNQGQIASPDQLLQNKVPGVEISTSSGQPGGGTTIRVRGTNSILNTGNPLIVIDGVELDGRDATPSLTLGNSLPFGPVAASNPLTYINPYDIQQVEVLKDASAAAIYGSRGANGVIAITTKKASSGPVRLEFGTSFGDNVGYMKTDDLMSASQFRSKLTQYGLGADSGSSVNALKAIEQHTLSQTYNLALSGGNDNGKFRGSLLASDLEGLIKTTDLKKYIGTFGGTYKFLDKRVTIDFNLIVGHTQMNQPLITNTAGAGGNLMAWVLNWNPTQSFYNPGGGYNLLPNGLVNPLAAISAYSDQSNVTTLLGNISATVQIIPGLTYKFLYAVNDGSGTRYTNIDGWLQGVQGVSGIGVGSIGTANINSQTITHTLNYHLNLTDNLKLDAVGGYEYWTTHYRDQSLLGLGFDINNTIGTQVGIPNTSHMADAKSLSTSPTSPSDPTVDIQSYFGRATFNLSDKYYLGGTFRADGSSKFGTNNRYGYFPSVSARWVASNENFMKASPFSNLALRASWGINGDQGFPAGAAQGQYTLPTNGAIGLTNVPNPNLKWQQSKTTDIGLEYGILSNRIYGSIDYYSRNTTNLIDQTTSIEPGPSGNVYINLPANLINSGVEFAIGAAIVDHKDFSWDAMYNVSYNKNMLKNFDKPMILTGQINGNGVSGVLAQAIANNEPLNEYYLPHFYGFTKAGADSVSSTNHFAGDPNPHVQMGFSNTFRYRKLSLVLNFGATFGYKVFDNTALAVTNIFSFSKGENTSLHAFVPGQAYNAALAVSDRYVENGNFVKLRNASLNYSFGDVGKYVKNLNVYLTGTNVFVITKYHGFDPEVNIDKSTTSGGQEVYPSRSMEYLPYPTPRIISLGLNVSL